MKLTTDIFYKIFEDKLDCFLIIKPNQIIDYLLKIHTAYGNHYKKKFVYNYPSDSSNFLNEKVTKKNKKNYFKKDWISAIKFLQNLIK